MKDIFINKILENLKCVDYSGIIIASPSKKDPDYFYHWIRDSAIIIRTLIKEYNLSNDSNLKNIIINYVKTEIKLQKLNTLSGLGEPKFDVNKTPFNEEWGRPQNDGPALRILAFIDILNTNIFNNLKIGRKKFIEEIIFKNILYICDNIHKPSFDLWEELYGYHLYTRLVQTKALKEFLQIYKGNKFAYVLKKYKEMRILVNHHINQKVISSYNNGKIFREYDTSVFLGICHIDFDIDIINVKSDIFKNYINDIINIFKKKYVINENYNFTFLGRYYEDKYYNGQIWYICTIGLLRVLNKFYPEKLDSKFFIEYIKNLEDYDLSEQIEDITMKKLSANNLTWNYSELYNLFSEYDIIKY